MSWRTSSSQPARTRAQNADPTRTAALILIAHLGHMLGVDALQEASRVLQLEFRIVGFDAKEKLVVGSLLEPRYVEQRMMRLRQFVHRQHAKNGKKRSAQHGQLERDRNERRPAVQRTSADVQGIGRSVHPKLEEK